MFGCVYYFWIYFKSQQGVILLYENGIQNLLMNGNKSDFNKHLYLETKSQHVDKGTHLTRKQDILALINSLNKTRTYSNSTYQDHLEMNNDLLCPANMSNIGHINLLKHIYRLQYPPDCDPKKRKFYIWKHECNVGMMANLQCIAFHFMHALVLNRTFLMYGHWTFSPKPQCQFDETTQSGMECFFLPISNCTIQKVQQAGINKVVKVSYNTSTLDLVPRLKKHKRLDNSPDIIWIDKKYGYRSIKDSTLAQGKYLRQRYGSTAMSPGYFRTILVSYLLRMQPFLRYAVDVITYDLYYKNQVKLDKTVSLMIRWGDKCAQSAVDAKRAESTCSTYHEEMLVIKQLKKLVPEIDTIIATSDTREVILNLTRDYTEWAKQNDMRFIINEYDVMPETGLYNRYHVDESIYSVMLSIMSTIKLQFGAKYYLLASGSSWSGRICEMAWRLKCAPNWKEDDDKYTNVWRDVMALASDRSRRNNSKHPSLWDPNVTVVKWPPNLTQIKKQNFGDENWNATYGVKNVWRTEWIRH